MYHSCTSKTTSIIKTIKGARPLPTLLLEEGDCAPIFVQWHVKKFGEKEFSPIDIEDTRINDKGFIFTISPRDINKKAVFNCELNLEE